MPKSESIKKNTKRVSKKVNNGNAVVEKTEKILDEQEATEARKEILNIIKNDNRENSDLPPKTQQKKPVAPVETESRVKVSTGRQISVFALAILIVIILTLGVFGVGIYAFGWDDKMITQNVVKVIPYPVAIVHNNPVTYSKFYHDLSAIQQYYNKQKELNPEAVTVPTTDELKETIIEKLIRDKMLMREAKLAGVNVSDSEIETELNNIIAESGGREELEQSLNDLYGWTIGDFTDSILKIYLLREKMQRYLSFDNSLAYNQEARTRIDEAYNKLVDGELDFQEAATQYSEDVTASQGGSLGFMTKEDLDQDFGQAAFNLGEGEVSGIVQTIYGYHIIKVDEVIMGVDSEDDVSSNGEERRNLSHILVKTISLDQWLSDKLNDAKVYNFVK